MQSIPSTELLSSILIYSSSSSLLSWANVIADNNAALSPNQLKYFLSRYNATTNANCLRELLPILSVLSNRYLEPGMNSSSSASLSSSYRLPMKMTPLESMISLPLPMTFLTEMVKGNTNSKINRKY